MTGTSPNDHAAGGGIQEIQALMAVNRLDEAQVLCDALCSSEPANAIAWGLRGALYTAKGMAGSAVECYRTACRLRPGHAGLHCNLGYTLQSLGRYPEAIECYESALRLDPSIAQIEVNLAYAFSCLNRFDEAMDHYRKARVLSPDLVPAIAGEADVLEKVGDLQQAFALLDPLIASGTRSVDVICQYAALCKDLGLQADGLAAVRRGLGRRDMSAQERARLHFSAGGLADDLCRYDEAFFQYECGNRLVAGNYNPDTHALKVTEAIEAFSPSGTARMYKASNRSERPVFIIGMPRSGTSLVEQILASHPAVFGGGELPDIHDMTLALANAPGSGSGYPRGCENLAPEVVDRLAGRYLEHLEALSPDALRVTDKTPHNFLHLGLITRLFPAARIIHCVRDPLDTCLSCYFRLFAAGNEYAYDLATLGGHYLQYVRLMRHWEHGLSIPMFEVRYETLIENQESVSRKLVEYCGLEWNDRCLTYHSEKRPVLSPSYNQVRKPIYNRSVGRWQHYADHLEPLRTALGDIGEG